MAPRGGPASAPDAGTSISPPLASTHSASCGTWPASRRVGSKTQTASAARSAATSSHLVSTRLHANADAADESDSTRGSRAVRRK